MIIKQLYLWKMNASWSDEDFVMFGVVVLSILCAFGTGMMTWWGLSIFGPWFQGSAQVWYFTWAAVIAQQFYFWTRWCRYVRLRRQNRLKSDGTIASNNIFKKWFQKRKDSKAQLMNAKTREREVALGFANELKKFTGGVTRV